MSKPLKPRRVTHNSKPDLDWEAIEREYRAGALSLDEIGRIYGVARQSIEKRAKSSDPPWERDLSTRVRRAVHTRLSSDEGDGMGAGAATNVGAVGADDAAIVDMAADRAVRVVREHRTTIKTARALVSALIGELREVTEEREAIERVIGDVTNDDRDTRRRSQMLRAISLPARAATMRDLAAAAKTLITLERQAFGIDEDHHRNAQPTTLGSLIEAVVRHRQQQSAPVIDITPGADFRPKPDDPEKPQ